jgi:hypothetical protein
MSNDKLEKWKAISSIISSIAIPFILVIVGYFIQKQLSDAGLKKDYVGIATGILKENPNGQDPDLRKWAITILDSNAPIPFSKKARANLERESIYIPVPTRLAVLPDPPADCMVLPKKGHIYALIKKLSKQEFQSVEQISKGFDELIVASIKAEDESSIDRIHQECLYKYAEIVKSYNAHATQSNQELERKLAIH